MKPSTYHFQMKMKILADFQICISVILILFCAITSSLLLRLLRLDHNKKQILIPTLTTITTPWSLQKIQTLILALRLLHRYHDKKNIKFHFRTAITMAWST